MDAQCIISEDSLKMRNVINQKSLIDTTYWEDKGLLHSKSYRIIRRDSMIIERHLNAYIKAEGKLEHNYKVGDWKYYDVKGNIVYTRHYKRNDKIDIRFPNCIWNKENPCFCHPKE